VDLGISRSHFETPAHQLHKRIDTHGFLLLIHDIPSNRQRTALRGENPANQQGQQSHGKHDFDQSKACG
jgi:hypothetical protein